MNKRVQHNGQQVDGELVDFTGSDVWAEYTLTDGTVLRVKLIVREVVKICGEYAVNGEPLYMVFNDTIVTQCVPEGLKKPFAVPPVPGHDRYLH